MKKTILLSMFLWLSLLFTVSVTNAAIIGWNDFSGSENWIDYSDWLAMPNPVYYQGCTFTEQGSGAGGPGWRDSDWTQYFENASNEYPGLSLGYGMADNHGITEIKVEFTDYSDIKRIGLLASTSVATTYELQAYDISHNLLESVEGTMPGPSTPVWLGLETNTEISYMLLTEPGGDNYTIGIFDDLRFEVPEPATLLLFSLGAVMLRRR